MEGTSSRDPSTAETSDSAPKLVEIKIKTLDSQVYSCSVDKNITVPELKDRIAALTGVPAESQRLICRGKVLKDDHTLTDYNVEDGHTLHLVIRQVPQSGATSSAGANAGQDDPSNDAARNRPTQISHSVVMGTFNVPDTGDGGLPDVNRIISSVLQSLGLGNIVPNAATNMGGPAVNPAIVAVSPPVGGQDTGPGGVRPIHVVNQPTISDRGASPGTWPLPGLGMLPIIGQQVRHLQQAMVIPDALTIINQCLDGLEHMLVSNGNHTRLQDATPSSSAPTRTSVGSPIVIRSPPSPANLGAIIQRTMSLINSHVVPEFNRLSSQLENESAITDTNARGELQSAALLDGVVLQYLGALLLELSRVTQTLRVGSSAMESAVNAGPAVFISPAGPTPLMVQPLPFQTGPGFGIPSTGTLNTTGAMGYPEIPRNVSIHIHANDPAALSAFPAPGQGLATGSVATQVPGTNPAVGAGTGVAAASGSSGIAPTVHAIAVPMQVSGPSASNEQPGIRVVPMRTVVATVPPATLQGRSMVDGTGVHPSILHPIFARFQQLSSQQGVNIPGGNIPSPTTTLPPSSVAQQVVSSAAPVARVPEVVASDGLGVSSLMTNGALHTSLNPSQAPSSSNQQRSDTAGLQVNLREDAKSISTVVNDTQSLNAQLLCSDQPLRGPPEAVIEVQDRADEVMKESPASEGVNATSSHDTANAEENPKDGNKTNVPAGLGLGGLRPLPARAQKRSGRQQRPPQAAGLMEHGVHNPESPADSQGLSSAGDQRGVQSPSLGSDSRNGPSQPSLFPNVQNNNSSQRGGGANLDMGNWMSQLSANSGAPITRSRDQDQSMALSGGTLGNLMSQVMQNPFMRNVVQQVVEQVGEGTFDHNDSTGQGGTGNPPGGVDFSRLLQDMMPVVSQAMNRVGNPSSIDGGNARGDVGTRQGSLGFPNIQSNGSSVSNGPNISAIFQQMMPAVAAFSSALAGRTEQVTRIPPNVQLTNADGRETALAQEQTLPRDEVANVGVEQPEAPAGDESEVAPAVKRQKKQ